MITGPKGPFTNIPPAAEVQIEWIARAIARAERTPSATIEATHEAERQWSTLCDTLASKSLFWEAEGERRSLGVCLRLFEID